jgi:hypothetical protein
VPAAAVLARLARQLEREGYDVVARSDAELNLFWNKVASRPRHRLQVRSDGVRVAFAFAWDQGELEQPQLEQIADQALAAVEAGAPLPAAARRCAVCGTAANAGDATCAVCGITL